jgi:hypothetical protein
MEASVASLSRRSSAPGPRPRFRPDDVQVERTDPDVKLWSVGPPDIGRTSRAREVIINAPAPGEWRVDVSGAATVGCSKYSIIARGRSRIRFGDFDFVTSEDDPGEGRHYFPIDGMPVTGEPALARARITPDLLNPVFRLADRAGNLLETLALGYDDRAPADGLIGPVQLPAGSFVVIVSGRDESGGTVQRQFPSVFHAQTVEVTFNYEGLLPVLAGSNTAIRVQGQECGRFARDVCSEGVHHSGRGASHCAAEARGRCRYDCGSQLLS